MKLYMSLAVAAIVAAGVAQEPPENRHFVSVFVGQSAIVLGSSQYRLGAGFSYGSARFEPKFKTPHFDGQMVCEGYYDHTRNAAEKAPYVDTDALGLLVYGRWYARMPRKKPRPFFDVGWGFQYADRKTIDLSSEVNSTPTLDVGCSFATEGSGELLLSLRYLHISNAGLVKPNRGQNQIYVMVSLVY